MKFARKQYRGRPTKWVLLSRYGEIKRTAWKDLRTEQRHMLVEGRISVQAFKFNYNLELCEGWKWIQKRLARAHETPDPVKHLNQLNIYKLEQCINEIESELKRIEAFVDSQRRIPLADSEGYEYNTRYKVSEEERRVVAYYEDGVEFAEEN